MRLALGGVRVAGASGFLFRRHFGYPQGQAEALMLRVHSEGRAVVSTGLRERMEADVVAMHAYGLRATLEPVP